MEYIRSNVNYIFLNTSLLILLNFIDSCEFATNKYYALCAIGGILACGPTHTAVVPLDLVKCRMQVDPAKYKNLFQGLKLTLKEDGTKGLAKGWAPTLIGYSMQVSISFWILYL